jgi:hypothetical protein
VGFVVYKVALRQVSSEYFSFPCEFSFYQMLHTHLSSGACTIGQLVADVPSGLSLTPKKNCMVVMKNGSTMLIAVLLQQAKS